MRVPPVGRQSDGRFYVLPSTGRGIAMQTCAIVNPVAGRGQARIEWPRIEPRLRDVSSSFTDRWTTAPDSAERLTRDALREGFERIVAVGGDGTLHEVVNGFFEDGSPVNPEAVLAHLACGSGSDFRRSLGATVGEEAAEQLERNRIEPLDLIHVEYATERGASRTRYVVNIASFGLSGTVVRKTAKTRRFLPPRLHYLVGALRVLSREEPASVEITLDNESLGVLSLWLGAVANGHTFASGLPIAPTASPSDGLLDVTLLKDMPVLSLLGNVPRFYRGTHVALPTVRTLRGRTLTVDPIKKSNSVWLEGDGEPLGRLPATFTVIPQAIEVQY